MRIVNFWFSPRQPSIFVLLMIYNTKVYLLLKKKRKNCCCEDVHVHVKFDDSIQEGWLSESSTMWNMRILDFVFGFTWKGKFELIYNYINGFDLIFISCCEEFRQRGENPPKVEKSGVCTCAQIKGIKYQTLGKIGKKCK